MEPIEPGQFDDAPEETTPAIAVSRPANHTYIDLTDPESSSDELSEPEEDDYLDEDYLDARVEDEDWEISEKDFTKQYNRLRQHVAIRQGNAQGVTSALNSKSSVAIRPAVNHPQQQQQKDATNTTAKDRTSNQLDALAKYNSRLSGIDAPYMGVSVNRKGPSATANLKDKADRATNEQVLDPRTRLILFKMIGRGLLHTVNGCISTGKEANVYHAITPPEPTTASTVPNRHLALKIYKTSILVFKDRDKYVSGEHRFRRGYSRHNPRKMVRVWAEKEMRNLKRLTTAGIRAPEALEVRENVLVMDFLGDGDCWASPRLKDANPTKEECDNLYPELLLIVRTMFHQCKLVHADLSEYNILLHEGHLWIIDVSQSVEHDHPAAFDFLRNDLRNVEEFFGRRDVRCVGLRRAFEFVTRDMAANEDPTEVLQAWRDEPAPADEGHDSTIHEDEVFRKSYIPRTLNDLYDPERDAEALGDGKKPIYANTIALVNKDSAPQTEKSVRFDGEDLPASSNSEQEEEEEGAGEDESEDDEVDFKDKALRGHRHEDKDAKKARKKATKEEAREKRKQKMPKSEKKRIMKKSRV
ncbi:RIO1-domain-containing protein [Cylindrobasidium torrendii FP15055 ss-10]|uniref:Serine/threonine-protein kinase RIO1 n=1 Tax=Cylindrobasidium torrendii FP15055 ss-10 TaxID=1314674 RepID=A0A0D7BU90_9AGAR|nr:RIO1-domain-containing protein [Cylindrobasidium torrendii FP15055 ss-10]